MLCNESISYMVGPTIICDMPIDLSSFWPATFSLFLQKISHLYSYQTSPDCFKCNRCSEKRVSAVAISKDGLFVCFADKFGVVWALNLDGFDENQVLVDKKAAPVLAHYCSIITSLVCYLLSIIFFCFFPAHLFVWAYWWANRHHRHLIISKLLHTDVYMFKSFL